MTSSLFKQQKIKIIILNSWTYSYIIFHPLTLIKPTLNSQLSIAKGIRPRGAKTYATVQARIGIWKSETVPSALSHDWDWGMGL